MCRVVLFAAVALLLHAREAGARWQYYDEHNRLKGAAIWQIVEDKSGRVWLLDRNDNVLRNSFDDWPFARSTGELAEYTLADGYSLYPNQTLTTGADGTTWFPVFTRSGLFPQGEAFVVGFTDELREFALPPLLPGVPLAIAPTGGDTVFVSTSSGLFRIGPRDFNFPYTTFSPAPPGSWVTPMKVDRDGTLWVGASDPQNCGFQTLCRGAWLGVARLDGASWRLFTVADGLAPEPVVGLLQAADGAMWAVHEGNHVSRFDGTTWHAMEIPFKGPTPQVSAWAADPVDGIWLAATGALSHLGFDGWRTYGDEEGVPQNQILALCVDHCSQVWVGLDDGRVGRFSDERRGDPRGPQSVQRLFEDASGTVWSTSLADSLRSFDGLRWPARGNGLPGGVGAVFQTRVGAFWAATSLGVRRLDGSVWVDCCADTASPQGEIQEMTEAPNGDLWFEGSGDVWRYDGTRWTHYRRGADFDTAPPDPPPLKAGLDRKTSWQPQFFAAHRILADSAGRVWVLAGSGCSMFDHGAWRDFRVANGMAYGGTYSLHESPQGDIWTTHDFFGGFSRFRNGAWVAYPGGQNGSFGFVYDIVFDRAGDLWAKTDDPSTLHYSLTRFHAEHWDYFSPEFFPDFAADFSLGLTLEGNARIASWTRVSALPPQSWAFHYTIWNGQKFITQAFTPEPEFMPVLLAQRDGRLWLSSLAGLRTFDPDRTAPQTVVLAEPAPLIAGRTPSITATATRSEAIGIEFSFQLDGSLGRDWSPVATWQTPALGDTEHIVEVRARDILENTDPVPARVRFVVDGTAPIVSLASPTFNAVVRGIIAIQGSIVEAHPKRYLLAIRRASADSAAWDTLASGITPPSDTLAVLATTDSTDGSYELSLEAEDQLGLHSTVLSRIRIDNVAPSASQVSPVDIEQYSAGDVFSEDLLARAYFPPGSFNTRAHVELDALGTDSLASAGIPHFTALRGYRLRWGAITLMPGKVGILDLSTEGLIGGPPWVVETRTVDGSVVRLGGSVDGARVSVPLTASGVFYVGVEDSAQDSPGTSLALSLSPRVFRPGASAALSGSSGQLAIAFGLAQPERVTLAVFNRAGRRLRLLTDHETMPQGDHVVRWDGRDEDGRLANDGLYMISAEFGGNRRVLPFAIVR
jgi:hypothetical protein